MDNTIILRFRKDQSAAVGFDKGAACFASQVNKRINDNEPIKIVFPSGIKKVTSSFVQGFFHVFLETKGYEWILENVAIETVSDALTEKIRRDIR